MSVKIVLAIILALPLGACSTYSSGFEVTSRGLSVETTAAVASAVSAVIPKPKLKDCFPGQVLVTDSNASVDYQSDSNGLNGPRFRGNLRNGAVGRRGPDRRTLDQVRVDETRVRARQETYCAWPRN